MYICLRPLLNLTLPYLRVTEKVENSARSSIIRKKNQSTESWKQKKKRNEILVFAYSKSTYNPSMVRGSYYWALPVDDRTTSGKGSFGFWSVLVG